MVEGVQVTLPSYEEAVSGAGGAVLPRLLPQTESIEHVLSQTSTTHAQHTEISVVHQPSSSSSFSSSWSLDGAQEAAAESSAFQCQNPDASQQNSLLSLHDSEQNLADGKGLLYYSFITLILHSCLLSYLVFRMRVKNVRGAFKMINFKIVVHLHTSECLDLLYKTYFIFLYLSSITISSSSVFRALLLGRVLVQIPAPPCCCF